MGNIQTIEHSNMGNIYLPILLFAHYKNAHPPAFQVCEAHFKIYHPTEFVQSNIGPFQHSTILKRPSTKLYQVPTPLLSKLRYLK